VALPLGASQPCPQAVSPLSSQMQPQMLATLAVATAMAARAIVAPAAVEAIDVGLNSTSAGPLTPARGSSSLSPKVTSGSVRQTTAGCSGNVEATTGGDSICNRTAVSTGCVAPDVIDAAVDAACSSRSARRGGGATVAGARSGVGGSRSGVSTQETEQEGLRRFTLPQRDAYPIAMREIQAGQKETCWMWYMIPGPPHLMNGVERGSARNRRYALKNDEEVRAYLAFEADGVNLRSNYLSIMGAVRDQLQAGRRAMKLLGPVDEPKLRTSARLFERITRGGHDEELHSLLLEVMRLLKEEPDEPVPTPFPRGRLTPRSPGGGSSSSGTPSPGAVKTWTPCLRSGESAQLRLGTRRS